MNKQEATKELYQRKIQNENRYLPNEWSKGHQNGLCEGLQDSIKIVEQIDEPEKPVVPQVVINWYEKHKDNLSKDILYFIYDYYNDTYEDDIAEEFANWFHNNKGTALETIVKMKLYSYEAEKEELYTAMLLLTGEYLCLDSEGDLSHFKVNRDYILGGARAYQFTKHTLIKYKVWENDNYLIEEVEQ